VALSGPVEVLHRRKVPRPAAVGLVVLGLILPVGLAGYLFFPEIERQALELSFALPDALDQLGRQLSDLTGRFGLNVGAVDLSTATLVDWSRRLIGGALGLFMDAASLLLGVVVTVFVALYLAADPRPVVGWTLGLFPPEHRPRVREILVEIRASLLSWLKGRLASMAIVGALSTVALYAIGIPGALFLGLFAGLVSFVPYIGPIVSAIPPLLLAFAFGSGYLDALWIVLAYVAVQVVESNILTPLIMRKTASLHPAVVVAAVTLLGAAFGIMGALLALPLTVAAGVLVRELWFRRLDAQA
jgi:predicted PurR-regulated permease PerM